MINPGHFQIFGQKPDVKTRYCYKPKTIKVIFYLALVFLIVQGCSQSGLSESEVCPAGQGSGIANSVDGYRLAFTNENDVFVDAFDIERHDDRGSQADGTLVVKALGEHEINKAFVAQF